MTHDVQPGSKESITTAPKVDEIAEYLRAFYHGIEVRRLPDQLSWVPWKTTSKKEATGKMPTALPNNIGLKTGEEIVRVRMRHRGSSDNSESDSSGRDLFRYQLNQLDLLDGAEAALPADAYCLLLVVNHDMYEDEEDDFCCGRAFGGNQIAVVSTARYDPALDEMQGVNREHAWPASHCADFVARACGREEKRPSSKKRRLTEEPEYGALREAVKSHNTMASFRFDAKTTYLLRVARTASHEIGHCFGMDHCMYYACIMQGTCSLLEDNRQPPYLCPVCEAKVGHVVAKGRDDAVGAWKVARHEAILKYCARMGGAFGPLGAWTKSVLISMEHSS